MFFLLVLLDPPVNLSLHPNGQVGQLNPSWTSNIKDVLVKYRIEYSSEVLYKELDLEVHTSALLCLSAVPFRSCCSRSSVVI